MTERCSRCGREGTARDEGAQLPDGWEGWIGNAVCPECQFVEWHPHCTAVRSDCGSGGIVDVAALEGGEQVMFTDMDGDLLTARTLDDMRDGLGYCGYLDLSVSWIDDADWPKEWRCTDCGGTEFEGVHRPQIP